MNKVILIGRLTANPEDKMTNSGTSVCEFSLAVDRPYQKGAEKQTDFVNCVAWRGTAEFIVKHFTKGKMMLAEGHLQNDKWTDKDGYSRDKWRVTVENVEFVGNKEDQQKPSEETAPFGDEDIPF